MLRTIAAALTLPLFASTLGAQAVTTQTVATGLSRPTWVGSPPGDERIFVCEQNTGRVRIIDGSGTVLPTPFLDVSTGPFTSGGERGLLGLAFHPKFAQNGYFFVNFTQTGGSTAVVRYEVSAGNPDVADGTSAQVILNIPQPDSNHNAGDIAFSPIDGYLYVPMGDGGGANDNHPGGAANDCNGQNDNALLGAMLRIDVDNGLPYTVPADNPFVGVGGVRPEIWSTGWRNPFRFSFDRLTGDLYVGDVGQGAREEIDFEPAGMPGLDYGWPVMEGTLCNNSGVNNCSAYSPPACFDSSYTGPVFEFVTGCPPFGSGDGCAVIGGVVYRGCRYPDLQGTYFFGDNGTGKFWSLEMSGGVATNIVDRTAQLSGSGGSVSAFGEDMHGDVLIADLSNGRISRIVPVAPIAISDCDGNSYDDPCEVATISHADTDGSGTVDACETFSVDSDVACLSVGGAQAMSLHAGAGHAGELYVVAGSFAGTSPGIPFGPGITLPLNYDFYFGLTITDGALMGPSFLGVLDGSGSAPVTLNVPTGLPGVISGLTASHAYVTLGGGNIVTSASNFTTLRFDP